MISYIVSTVGSSDFSDISTYSFSDSETLFIYIFLFLGFGFKVPL